MNDNVNTTQEISSQEISRIKLPNDEVYNIKDSFLRAEIEKLLGPIYSDENDQQ